MNTNELLDKIESSNLSKDVKEALEELIKEVRRLAQRVAELEYRAGL